MNNVTNSTSFKGIDYTNVCALDRKHFIKNNLKNLQKFSDKYDINLTSCYSNIPGFDSIDIVVKPLKEELTFFGKIFTPKGKSSFNIEYNSKNEPQKTKEDFLQSVNEAVCNLREKLGLHN